MIINEPSDWLWAGGRVTTFADTTETERMATSNYRAAGKGIALFLLKWFSEMTTAGASN